MLRRSFLAAAAALVGLAGSPKPASAGDLCRVIGQQRFSGLEAVVLTCQQGGHQDLVYVAGVEEERVLRREQGTWLVDAYGDGSVNLAVEFGREGSSIAASLYDDQDGDTRVAFRAVESGVEITESTFPSVGIHGLDGRWTEGGRVSFNLDIKVDGPVPAMFGAEAEGFPGRYLAESRIDGEPDVTIQVRDSEARGRPASDVRQGYFRASPSTGIGRTHVMKDEGGTAFPFARGAVLPYLGDEVYGIVLPYGRGLAPIQVDWQRGRIAAVGEFVPSRATDAGWFVYSLLRVGQGSTVADFENPFAFYDLAGRRDGRPDLQIRQEYFPPFDRYFPSELAYRGRLRQGKSGIRYSWDQDRNGTWDFKVDLAGTPSVDQIEQVGGLALKTVRYQDFPRWVTEQVWPMGRLVEAPPGGFNSTEGIYTGTPSMELAEHLVGIRDEVPAGECERLEVGYRVDCSFNLRHPPRLYLGSIDHQLHLLGAEEGVWRVSDQQIVRYRSLAGQGYLDAWDLEEQGELSASLRHARGYLVYADNHQVLLKPVEIEPYVVHAPPPRDGAEWRRLGELLRSRAAPANGVDLLGMYRAAPGGGERIGEAGIRNFRLVEDGFRFVLEVRDTVSNGPTWARGLERGEHVVSYRMNTGFGVEPLRTADLKVRAEIVMAEGVGAGRPVEVVVRGQNDGNEDAAAVAVRLTAEGPREPPIEVGRVVLQGLAGSTETRRVGWRPPQAGRWAITARSEQDGAELARLHLEVPEEARAGGGIAWLRGLAPGSNALWSLALLTGGGLAAAGLAGALFGGPGRGPERREVGDG